MGPRQPHISVKNEIFITFTSYKLANTKKGRRDNIQQLIVVVMSHCHIHPTVCCITLMSNGCEMTEITIKPSLASIKGKKTIMEYNWC